MRLSLMVENHWATIVANPEITTQDRESAVIRVIEEEYFIILAEGTYVRSELEKIESGIILEVTPYIGDDDEITLLVTPEVSNVVAEGEQGLPIVTRRQVSTTVRVKNGGTVIIAGLLYNRSRDTEERVPLVSTIPVVGAFFRKDEAAELDRQIAVLITPRIIEDAIPGLSMPSASPKQAKLVGKEFKDQLKMSLEQDRRD
jgi:type IV pilus assembly protein PilQ